jgi:Fe2+ transport system protein FeoA
MLQTLVDVPLGKSVVISKIEKSHISAKLVELGFTEGTTVEVAFHAPFKDPIAIELNGSIISLRRDEASTILVQNNTP